MRTEKEERIRIRKTERKTTTTGWKCRERTRHKSHQNRLRGENVIRFFARGLSFTREEACYIGEQGGECRLVDQNNLDRATTSLLFVCLSYDAAFWFSECSL